MAMSNRFDLLPECVKALEIALRVTTGLTVSDADKAWIVSPVGMTAASMAWSKLSAVRNYHEASGRL